jgi:hypothetical protein
MAQNPFNVLQCHRLAKSSLILIIDTNVPAGYIKHIPQYKEALQLGWKPLPCYRIQTSIFSM